MTCVSLYNIKQRSHPHHPTPDRLNLNPKQRSPLTTQHLIAYLLKSNSDLTHATHKTRSPISSNQTAIALFTKHQTDRLFPTSNSDRTLTTHKTRSPKFQIKQRSPLNTQNTRSPIPQQTTIAPSTPTNPDRLFPHIKQRSPLNTNKTRSPIPSTPNSDRPFHNPQNLIAYFPRQTFLEWLDLSFFLL